MDFIEFLNLFISLPDRGKACSLCSHNIHANTEVCTQSCNARSHKFHNFILNISIGKYFTDDCQCNVLWTYSRAWLTFQINGNYPWHINIIGLGKELFYQFSTAFTHSHGAKCTITCMAVRTKDHFATTCKHFSCILMNNSLMRRYIYTAVFLGTGKSKHVIIFVDCSAYRTKGVVAVGQYIWNREFLKP